LDARAAPCAALNVKSADTLETCPEGGHNLGRRRKPPVMKRPSAIKPAEMEWRNFHLRHLLRLFVVPSARTVM
jgi:hypothetical protein